uniref:RRM domain-containing protein n=1 Tax=Meloidogyne javanica TaxID=6303 RepID=A0A915LGY4_MELJA
MGEDTWTVERFQLELLNAEKTGQFTCKDLEPLWDKAKLAIQNEEEAVSLYTTYIYLTFRLLKKQGSSDFSDIEELFEDGIYVVIEYFDEDSESFIQFQKNFAYFLYAKMGKLERAREIWTNLLKGENGPFAWLEAISLERKYGDVEYARKLFYKALDNVNFHPHVIYSAFIQFEREEGNRSELDLALERVNLIASNFAKNEKEQEKHLRKRKNFYGKMQGKNEGRKGGGCDKGSNKKQKIEEKNGNNFEEKRPQQKNTKQKNEVTRGEEMDIDTIEEEQIEKEEGKVVTFETSNIPIVLDVRIITKWNGRSKGCAYIDFETDLEASAAILKANGEKIRAQRIGKASRLMLPTSISKNKNVEVKEEEKSTTTVNSPMGEIVQSTEEISMEQK